MKHIVALIAILATAPAAADVARVIDTHILPGYARFTAATATLRETALDNCKPEAVKPAWNDAFDAWLGISHIRFGPIEDDGRSIAVAYWPDERGAGPRALTALLAETDPIIDTPEGTAQISVAARGLFGLEYLLYDPQFSNATPYHCALVRALTADLAELAATVNTAWTDNYAETLRRAGDADNSTYLSEREATQAVFTSLLAGLEFDADQRLGRPMGTFDRPRPTRAESWRSDRSRRNLGLSLAALHDLSMALADKETPVTDAAFARAITRTRALNDPAFADVTDPSGRLKVEVVQQDVRAARNAVLTEIGQQLGVSAGFNSADGD